MEITFLNVFVVALVAAIGWGFGSCVSGTTVMYLDRGLVKLGRRLGILKPSPFENMKFVTFPETDDGSVDLNEDLRYN
jgi:hypothetical protein